MISPTYPGVYIQEVSSGVRPISAASTSTAAFIGLTERGPINESVRILNFTQFQNIYGGFLRDGYLAHSVFQYFNNGGSICYVVRVLGGNSASASISLQDQDGASAPILEVTASSPGAWGNDLELRLSPGSADSANEFNLEIYESGAIEASEIFENLSMASGHSNFVEEVVNSSNLVRVSVTPNVTLNDLSTTAGVSSGSGGIPDFENDGSLSVTTFLRIQVNGDVPIDIDLTNATAALDSRANVRAGIEELVRAAQPTSASVNAAAYSQFTATLNGANELVLTSGFPGLDSEVKVLPYINSLEDASAILNLGLLNGGIETTGVSLLRPVFNTDTVPRYLVGDHAVTGAVLAVVAGTNGDAITTDVPYVNALPLLDERNDVSLIAIPGVSSPFVFGEATAYCENRSLSDCFYIGEPMAEQDTVDELVEDFVAGISPKNSYGAIYTPWLKMPDPLGISAEPIEVPPSGFVAGLYAKTDSQRGVWKAPAGTSVGVAGSTGLLVSLTDVQQGLLNQKNINVIREFSSSGRVIWGARTITSDPEWRYVPVRRMAIFLRVSIYNGIQWAVFEPNDVDLWSNLRLNLNAFMNTLFRRGAFQGATASDAYFVKVDSETTTQADIDNGIVNINVGFAPLKPAEFVVVSLSQKAGQS